MIVAHTSQELVRFVCADGENTHIDAKGPMEWDGGEASAGVAKDILAFANSRDGGVIVIGKEEESPGKFRLVGLSPSQADSFETTKVAAWLNSRCTPSVNLTCYRVPHDGMEFIVLTVAEFDDVPSICTKQFQLPGKPPNVILRKGTIYVRTANAESAPLSCIEDLRALIGIATTKRGDQLLSMFQATMKGQPFLSEKGDEERWAEQLERVQSDLDDELGEQASLGRWVLSFRPSTLEEERWGDAAELRALAQKHVVRIRDQFPGIDYNYQVREWGICSHEFQDIFGLTRSGLFVAHRVFREDVNVFKDPYRRNPEIPEAKWIDFKRNMAQVIEFFMFMSRFIQDFDVGEEVTYEVMASPLRDRVLVSLDPEVRWFEPHPPCKAAEFIRKRTISVEALRSGWERECAGTLLRFFQLLNAHRLKLDVLLNGVDRFKKRTFWS